MGRRLRWTLLTLAAVFALAAALQFNDPDPVPWIAIYGAAAACCAWSALRPATFPRLLGAAVGATALVWAATLLPSVLGKVRFSELFASFEMKSQLVEIAREAGGLLIVVAGMALSVAAPARVHTASGRVASGES